MEAEHIEPRQMTPDEIRSALARLIPDALALIERSLRETSRPTRSQTDTAWLVIDRGLKAHPAQATVDRDVAQLAEVLEFVTG